MIIRRSSVGEVIEELGDEITENDVFLKIQNDDEFDGMIKAIDKPKMATIELDVSLEDYFKWNEAARKEGLLFDAWVAKALTEYMDNHKDD